MPSEGAQTCGIWELGEGSEYIAFEEYGSNMKGTQRRNFVFTPAEHGARILANNILDELLSYLSTITREDLTVFPSWS